MVLSLVDSGAKQAQRESKGLSRLGAAVVAVGLLGWIAVLTAARRIPSPARETVFVDTEGRTIAGPVHCHGTLFIDRDSVWLRCDPYGSDGARRSFLTRFDTRSGRATLLGALPDQTYGLHGGLVGPDGVRVFLTGNQLIEAHQGRLRALGTVSLPIGMAAVGHGVEVASGRHTDVRIVRFEGDRRVNERALMLPPVAPSDPFETRVIRAYHDGVGWRVLVLRHPRRTPALPVEAVLYDQDERGAGREVARLQLGSDEVVRSDTGEVSLASESLVAGHVVGLQRPYRFVRIYGPEGITAVRLPDAPFFNIAAVFLGEGPHARLSLRDVRERRLWIDGRVYTFAPRGDRFLALGLGERTGPTLVSSFWMTPGLQLVPHADGSITALGALGGSYIQVGRDLARTDALSLGARFARLFVPDRARRNAGLDRPLGLARFAIIPFILLGPLVGTLVLRLRGRVALRRGLALGWLAVAGVGGYAFSYYLRFFF